MLHTLSSSFLFPFGPCCILMATRTSPYQHFLSLPYVHRHRCRRSNILKPSRLKKWPPLSFHNLVLQIPRPSSDQTSFLFPANGIASNSCNTRHVRFTVSTEDQAAFRTRFAVHVCPGAASLPFLSPAAHSF